MKSFLRQIKKVPVLYTLLVRIKRSYQQFVGKRHRIQNIETALGYKFVTLGSENCGWTFVDDPTLKGCVILSAGLGEDGSFDTEFASMYGATVHIVDPTPRAIAHFSEITSRLGSSSEAEYSRTGTQRVESYELRNVQDGQIRLHKVALWSENKKVRFFLPKNTSHVSHSIINFQNSYSPDTAYIEVDAITIRELIDHIGIAPETIAMVKLDIEGAEIEVIETMISDGFLPYQLLVEFDEFNAPTRRGVARIDRVHSLLVDQGYKMIKTDGQADFLYVRD